MQVSKKLLRNVLRAITAADPVIEKGNEDAPAPDKPEKEDVPPKEADTLKVVSRVFFYSIDPNKKISFSNMNDILSGTAEKDKKELIDNLKGGNTADFNADYFKWSNLLVKAVSQQDESKSVVYKFDLNPWGTKSSEGSMVKSNSPGFNPPPPGDIASDPNYKLFATINGIPEMVNLSIGPESIYSTDSVSDQYANRLLTSRAESTLANKVNYESFKTNIFSYYRIWVPITANELRNVDGSKPNSDQLPPSMQRTSPGHYKGGGTFFKKFMAEGRYKLSENEKEEEAPVAETEVKKPAKPGAPEFTPVEKKAMLREINKDDPKVNQYEGDNSCMKDLAYAQAKSMKIWKQAFMSSMAMAPAPQKPDMISVQVPASNSAAAQKVMKTTVDTVKKMENLRKGLNVTPGTQTTQAVQSGYTSTGMAGKHSSTMVNNVVKKYFNS